MQVDKNKLASQVRDMLSKIKGGVSKDGAPDTEALINARKKGIIAAFGKGKKK